MRTTLDIADDVLLAAKALAKRQHKSAGQVLSELARESLTRPLAISGDDDAFFGFRPLPADGVVVTNEMINQLRDEDIY